MPLDFSVRSQQPELMDTEACSFEEFRGCLVDLEKVNAWTFTYRPIIAFLERLARRGLLPKDRPIAIVDVGSGYGGMLRRIERWARAHGMAVDLAGIDLNPWSAKAAAEATDLGAPIRWVTSDLFDYRPEGGIDLVVSSQFTHHLDDAQLVRFLRWMEETTRVGWFIGDLHRHRLPYWFFTYWSRFAGWHRFVQHDGPVSISRAFVTADWRRLLRQAGIGDDIAKIEWWMPFRLCVSRAKPE